MRTNTWFLAAALGACLSAPMSAAADPGFDVTGMGAVLANQTSTPLRSPLTTPVLGGASLKICVVKDALGFAKPESGNSGLSRCRHHKTNAVLQQAEGGIGMWWYPQTNVYTWKPAPGGTLPSQTMRLSNQTPCRARISNTSTVDYAVGKVISSSGRNVCQHGTAANDSRVINAPVFDVIARK
jgi:hypothetical protein